MLCRVLLTAVAVSCTLSREITAHTQAQQRLVQIKDLLCVLLLSGVQKDDLDVNTVKKLLRHNVNISAFDDLKVRQECIAKAIYEYQNRNTESHNGEDEHNKTLRRKETYEVRTKDNTNGNNYHEKMDLESVINYATNRRQSLTELNDIEDTTTKLTDTQHNEIQNDHKDENNNSSTEISHTIPKYKNVMSLWKKNGKNQLANVKSTTTLPHTDHNDVDINLEHSDSKSQFNSTSPSLEVEYISRMFAQYMSKAKGVTTTTVTTALKETYARDNPRPLPSWIPEDPESFLFRKNEPTTKTANPELDKLREKYLDDVINIETKQIEKLHTSDKSKNKSLHITINDILMLKENFKQFPFKYISDNTYEDNHVYSDNDVYANKGTRLRSNHPEHKDYKTTRAPKEIIKTSTILPVNLIKEIAESVKAILLQDIRKEITTTTNETTSRSTTREQETTTRTTTSITTTTPITTTAIIASTTERTTTLKSADKSVLEKLMELFQQLKNTQEKTMTSDNAKHKTTDEKISIAAFGANYNVRNGYGNQQMPREPYPSKQMDSFSLQPINPAVLQNIPINNIYHPPAITLQTNLNEIPPLGIPVSKQMSVINQNIIVTTRNPFAVPIKPKSTTNNFLYKHENETKERTQNEKTTPPPKPETFKEITVEKSLNDKLPAFVDLSKRERLNPIQDAYDASVDRNRNDRLYANPKRVQDNDTPLHIAINNIPSVRERNDMLLKTYSDLPKDRGFENPVRDNHWNAHRDEARFYTKNRGRASNRDYGSSRWDHNYKARYDSDDHDRARPQRERKRFHEQLEKYELPRNSREPVYRDSSRKERPVPREQLPLIKKSSYDDTHFRNFLNTQQKVNEMLENILATKRKLEERKLDRVLSAQAL